MKNRLILISIHLIVISGFAQNKECGLKKECLCDLTNEPVAHSFDLSDIIIQGKIIDLDTVQISEIITKESILKIEQDSLNRAECAKNVMRNTKVVRAKIGIKEIFKGQSELNEIYIITPLKEQFCSYSGFNIGENYIIYGTKNETADLYFLWTIDLDYFQLKPNYSIWTNKCKRTKLTEESELKELRETKKRLKNKR